MCNVISWFLVPCHNADQVTPREDMLPTCESAGGEGETPHTISPTNIADEAARKLKRVIVRRVDAYIAAPSAETWLAGVNAAVTSGCILKTHASNRWVASRSNNLMARGGEAPLVVAAMLKDEMARRCFGAEELQKREFCISRWFSGF